MRFLRIESNMATMNRGTSLIRNCDSVGPYSRTVPMLLWRSQGGRRFLMSEVPLYFLQRRPWKGAAFADRLHKSRLERHDP